MGANVLVAGLVAVIVTVTATDEDGVEVLEQLPVELAVGVAVTVPLDDSVEVPVEDVVAEAERVVV